MTLGAPSVTVPVLSSTTVFTSWAVSSASADLMRMPLVAPRPVPTMMAVGVARPSAHGHEMTSTLMACDMAVSSVEPPSIHTANVTTATTMTTGTNTPDILSAIFSMGAFVDVASSTSRMMPASVVSSPTRSARMVNHPVRFTVAPVTASPGRLSTGTLSPVITDSSTVPEPSSRVPSTGTPSPARTASTSPARTASTATRSSRPSTSRVASFGARSTSLAMASVVLPFARASKYLPSVMSVRIMAADSKYRSMAARCAACRSPAPSAMPIL